MELLLMLMLLLAVATSSAVPPTVHRDAAFAVKKQPGVPYGQGVLCQAQPCVACEAGMKSNGPVGCGETCQNPEPGSAGPAVPGCPEPQKYNLTLDLYTPVGAEKLGPRPAFVAIHSGGYSHNGEAGFAPSYEMDAACKHFASRGWVAITMVYRQFNAQTGGGLAPANWTGPSPLPKGWKGGFLPSPQAIYPAIRDTKHAIRWLRGQASSLNIDTEYFASGGWSAGACTSTFLASQYESDFTNEMNSHTDPTFSTMQPYLHLSSKVSAGVVWAGNAAATDTIDLIDQRDRYTSTAKTPLAMYRGAKDGTMTPWAQAEVQGKFNASGGHCDLFAVPGHGHGDLMPKGLVASRNGVPLRDPTVTVLNHSYGWLVGQMNLSSV